MKQSGVAITARLTACESDSGVSVPERIPMARWTGLVIFALLLLSSLRGAVAQNRGPSLSSPALSVEAYIHQIDLWTNQLTLAKTHPADLAQLRHEVPIEWRVSTGAQPVTVSTEWLESGLERAEHDPHSAAKSIDHLLVHLKAIREEAQSLAEDRGYADGSAPAKLQKILARPEFRHVEAPTWLDREIARFVAWVRDLIGKLFMKFAGNERILNSARWAPWILLIVAGGLLLTWMTLRILKRNPRRALNLPVQQAVPLRSWQRMGQEAREAAARHDFREAIRLAYLAAIYRLEDLKFWKVDPTRTHREYLRLVKSDRTEHEPLAQLTRQFELAWYGAHPVNQTDFDAALVEMKRLGCA